MFYICLINWIWRIVQRKPSVSLVFCLDLSFVKSGTLKSSTITVLLSLSAFSSINICFMYLSILMLSVCIHLQLLYPLDKLTLWLYLTHDSFWLIIYLSDVSIATPALFKLPFAWNIFYQCYTFSLCMSLKLKWVFCGQHIIQSFFFHPFGYSISFDGRV